MRLWHIPANKLLACNDDFSSGYVQGLHKDILAIAALVKEILKLPVLDKKSLLTRPQQSSVWHLESSLSVRPALY